MPRKPVTAEELMRELAADPEWVAMRDEKEAEMEKLGEEHAKDEADMIAEIRAAGFDIDTI